ncbi:MAG: SH3 domain-containing protein [Rivularia sp. ALOHA_DT_140]|nr:SH3 domain-containing protein [Rivularia sp. ALOHA_DT_140]
MLSNILKIILGVLLAMAILVGGGAALAIYFMNRTSINPPKPVFSNDKASVKAQAAKTPTPGATTAANSQTKTTPKPQPTPTKSPLEVEKPLPPGAYPATVTWPQGLILRSEPQLNAERLGGVGFNAKVIVLESSNDKSWQKIRIESSGQEAWVKAGNTKKVAE